MRWKSNRSFQYIDDLVEALVKTMNTGDDFWALSILETRFTIKELAELVVEYTGSRSKLIYLPLPEDDPKQRRPDISLAREKLNWEPTINLKKGLSRMIAHFKEKEYTHELK